MELEQLSLLSLDEARIINGGEQPRHNIWYWGAYLLEMMSQHYQDEVTSDWTNCD